MNINYEKFLLDNGLRVILHTDATSPMAVINVLYDVGARDEEENRTGFAHLFEHLMFGGSINIPEYDTPLQNAGGENNAYTTNDITNYYIQLPLKNIETALWLESDRMLSLAFSQKSLEVQKKVVCEEFKEHYLNKPYGDAWKFIREMAYTTHPYRWMTIGKNLQQIEEAQLEDVKAFFKKHYNPQNAVLCIAGNLDLATAKTLAEKWFGSIPAGEKYNRALPIEPIQTAPRVKTVTADVPLNAIYKVWHIQERYADEYYDADIISEILGGGQSAILNQKLIKELQLFSSINCYQTGSTDPGLFVIEGKVSENVTMEAAEQGINDIISSIQKNKFLENEIEKAKNKVVSMMEFDDMTLLSRASNLAFYEMMGDVSRVNRELDFYLEVTADRLWITAQKIFNPNNCSTLFYQKQNAQG